MRTLSSRNEEAYIGASDFSHDELTLIAALLCQVKLGFGLQYSTAAMSIMDKIEDVTDDPNFIASACVAVDPQILVLDSFGGALMNLPGTHYEIVV